MNNESNTMKLWEKRIDCNNVQKILHTTPEFFFLQERQASFQVVCNKRWFFFQGKKQYLRETRIDLMDFKIYVFIYHCNSMTY